MSRRYMIRYSDPVMNATPYDRLHECIGNNVGNLVYSVALMRTLMVDDRTEFLMPPKDYVCSDKEIDEINQTYSAFILNLADALRSGYEARLKCMTSFIRRLKIPCIIIGCGLRAPFEPGEDLHFGFDREVYDFFSAVLERSDIIGLRGEISGAYAKSLGFREEKDYTVIGCPSMYMYGDELVCKDTYERAAAKDALISINVSPGISSDAMSFMQKTAGDYPNAIYMPQNSADCLLMYYGCRRKRSKNMPDGWPCSPDHPFYKDHDAYIYSHPLPWIGYHKKRDLSVGTRMHGNITAVLAGTPALFLPQDARTRELCEYHGFAHIRPADLDREEPLAEAIKKVDFRSPLRCQKRNFEHYMDFLKRNGLPNIFEKEDAAAPFDRIIQPFETLPPMERIDRVSKKEASRRRREYMRIKLGQNRITRLIKRLR